MLRSLSLSLLVLFIYLLLQ
uniref:Uncharacterized protein n=1 Tax=Rhizophora mucronata TaxID=61149 RepID=A0A2P2QIG3_RHIMU